MHGPVSKRTSVCWGGPDDNLGGGAYSVKPPHADVMASFNLPTARALVRDRVNVYRTYIGRRFMQAEAADAYQQGLDATARNYGVSHEVVVNGRRWRVRVSLNRADPFPTVQARVLDDGPFSPQDILDVGRAVYREVLMPAGFRYGNTVQAGPNGRSHISHFRATMRDLGAGQIVTSTALQSVIAPARGLDQHRLYAPRAVNDDEFQRYGPSDAGALADDVEAPGAGLIPNRALRGDDELAARTVVFDYMPFARDGATTVADMPACTKAWRVDMPTDTLKRCRVFALLMTIQLEYDLPRDRYSCVPARINYFAQNPRGDGLVRTTQRGVLLRDAMRMAEWMRRSSERDIMRFQTQLMADPMFNQLMALNELRDGQFYEDAAELLGCRIFVYTGESGKADVYGLNNVNRVRFVGSDSGHTFATLYPAAEAHFRQCFGQSATRTTSYKALTEQTQTSYVCVFGACRANYFSMKTTTQCQECGKWSGLMPQNKLWELRIVAVTDDRYEMGVFEIENDSDRAQQIIDEVSERAAECVPEDDPDTGCSGWSIPMRVGTVLNVKATSVQSKDSATCKLFFGQGSGSARLLYAKQVAAVINSSCLRDAMEVPGDDSVDIPEDQTVQVTAWRKLWDACVRKSALARAASASTRGPPRTDPEFVTFHEIRRGEETKESDDHEEEDDGMTHICTGCRERVDLQLPSDIDASMIRFPRSTCGHVCRVTCPRVTPKPFTGGVWTYDIETQRVGDDGLQVPCLLVLQRVDTLNASDVIRNSEYSESEKAVIGAAEKMLATAKKNLEAYEQGLLLEAHSRGVVEITDMSLFADAATHNALKAAVTDAKRNFEQVSAEPNARVNAWMQAYEDSREAATTVFRGATCVRDFIQYICSHAEMRDGVIYAHNGGSFDHQIVLNEVINMKSYAADHAEEVEQADPSLYRILSEPIAIPTLTGTSLSHFILWRFAGMRFCDTICLIGPFPLSGLAARMGAAPCVTKIDFDAGVITDANMDAALPYCIRDVTVLSIALIRFREIMLSTSEEVCGMRVDPLWFNTAAGMAYELATYSSTMHGRVMRSTESVEGDRISIVTSRLMMTTAMMERPTSDFPDILRTDAGATTWYAAGPLGPRHMVQDIGMSLRIPVDSRYWKPIFLTAANMLKESRDETDMEIVSDILKARISRTTARYIPFFKAIAALAKYAIYRMRELKRRFRRPFEFIGTVSDGWTVDASARNSYFGGRTEAMGLVYQCRPDEVLRMCDVSSSYPYSYGTQAIPFGVGHLVGGGVIDPHKFVAELMRTDGRELICIANVRIKLPMGVENAIPVLPQRTGLKLVFANQCVHGDMSGAEQQDTIIGTWTGEDLRCAVQNGCVIESVFQATIYPESSVARNGCWNEYCSILYDIKSDPTKKHLREATKLLLNSPYGRTALHAPDEMTVMVTDLQSGMEAYRNAFADQNVRVEEMVTQVTVNDGAVVRKFPLERVYEAPGTCVAAGGYITAHSRRRLYEGFLQVRDHPANEHGVNAILYSDTDSITYISKRNIESMATLGSGLGAFEDDLAGKVCTRFVSFGPKTYALSNPAGCIKLRAKGLRVARSGASYPLCDEEGHVQTMIAPRDGFIVGREVLSNTQMERAMHAHLASLRTQWCLSHTGDAQPRLAMQEQVSSLRFHGALEKHVNMVEKRVGVTMGKRRIVAMGQQGPVYLLAYGVLPEGPAESHEQFEGRVWVADLDEPRMVEFSSDMVRAQRQRAAEECENDWEQAIQSW